MPPPPSSTLFPYTTLFRSAVHLRHLFLRQQVGQVIEPFTPRVGQNLAWPRAGVVPDEDLPDRSRRRSEEHTSELQSQFHLVCRLLLEKKKEQDYADAS